MTRIAVDAMGGDHAPDEIVRGCVAAGARGHDVVLVGDEAVLGPLLDSLGASLPVVHAPEAIRMDEDPRRALREKKEASVVVAARLVAEGEAQGFLSAGSTGAAMAAAAFVVGRLPGVSRPAIASIFPTGTIVLDAGANLTVRPEHLVQFAVMGSAVSQVYHGVDRPRVGLLNIGEEPGKGRELEKATHELLRRTPGIDFVGNVEGRDIIGDVTEVIVTDGFTGNVLLKTAEGVARGLYQMILQAVSGPEYQEALAVLMPAFLELRDRLDYDNVGGGHLVGVDGVVVIAHGSANRRAIASAVALAADAVDKNLVGRVARGIAAVEA
ncbi:MAG TPA: phosphate acyltransferase PlsX [Actinobacteria bacterium]|nr:phosphate acyltransferase PlsX [Actinomycetota bacterium]